MSDTDDSLVLVDAPATSAKNDDAPELVSEGAKKVTPSSSIELTEWPAAPSACQIVTIGSEENQYAFSYNKAVVQGILNKIPPHLPVVVVSVVGAFRTGKSFLLSWFLRYLQAQKSNNKEWCEAIDSLGQDGFSWKAGSDRNTTGIWMWSEPFLLDDKAVLLLDTQGMFDHETTMSLTASIFGFSTLLSSFQIYNVDKRIQEDNLQQLALFSEYARMAVGEDPSKADKNDNVAPPTPTVEVSPEGTIQTGTDAPKPFQNLEFLVRDWQHFEEDHEENQDYDAMEESMKLYLDKVIAERDAKDLQDTREQILSCFESISCYGLCHPGNAVTKKKYAGQVEVLDPTFLQLLVRYCERVFDQVAAKQIHGQTLTAAQLGVYIEAYAELFESGAKFPTAGTMLEATAKANNTNASQTSIQIYKSTMNHVAGPNNSNYVQPEELKVDHLAARREALKLFEGMANFGSKKNIDQARFAMLEEIDNSFTFYESLNEARNPLAGMELYVFPFGVGLVSYMARVITDLSCGAMVCRSASDALSHIYVVVIVFMGIVATTKFKQIKDAWSRFRKAVEVMTNEKSKKD